MSRSLATERPDAKGAGSGASDCLVYVQQLVCSRGGQPVLQGVDLQLRSGQLVALMGANGAGKSTLMACLLGLLPPQGGDVWLFGRRLPASSRRLWSQVGVAFQSASVDDVLTVSENLVLGAALWGAGGAPVRRRAAVLVERLGLGDRRHQRAGHLSGGLRRRLELGRALMHQPRLLLLDEAAVGLDPQALAEFWRLVVELVADEHIGVLAATHLPDEAMRCHRLAILHQGKMVVDAPPAELIGQVAGDTLVLSCRQPEALVRRLAEALQLSATIEAGRVHLVAPHGAQLVPSLMAAVHDLQVDALALRRPGLADVYRRYTGQALVGRQLL